MRCKKIARGFPGGEVFLNVAVNAQHNLRITPYASAEFSADRAPCRTCCIKKFQAARELAMKGLKFTI